MMNAREEPWRSHAWARLFGFSPAGVCYNPADIVFCDHAYWNANLFDWQLEIRFFDIGVFGGYRLCRGWTFNLVAARSVNPKSVESRKGGGIR